MKDTLDNSLVNTLTPEASSCKYLGIILRSELSWADQVNYRMKSTKSLAYMSLVHPILEYGAPCWDLYREGQITVLDRVQKKVAKFAHQTNSLNWETLASCRKLSYICTLFKAYR